MWLKGSLMRVFERRGEQWRVQTTGFSTGWNPERHGVELRLSQSVGGPASSWLRRLHCHREECPRILATRQPGNQERG